MLDRERHQLNGHQAGGSGPMPGWPTNGVTTNGVTTNGVTTHDSFTTPGTIAPDARTHALIWHAASVRTDLLRTRPSPGSASGAALAAPALDATSTAASPDDDLVWLRQLLDQAAIDREQRVELFRTGAASLERPLRVRLLNRLGRLAHEAGDAASARVYYQEALTIARELRDPASVDQALSGLGCIAIGLGAFDLARGLYEECLVSRQRTGRADTAARVLAILGWLAFERGALARAEALHEECLTLRCATGDALAIAWSLLHLGWLAHLRGDRVAAERHLTEALRAVWDHPERWKIVALLSVLGRPSTSEAPARQAVRLLAGAEAHGDVLATGGAEPSGSREPVPERRTCPAGRSEVRRIVASWADGGDVSLKTLVEQVLGATKPRKSRRGGKERPREGMQILTARERETVVLVGRGYTNRRIADELVISERTAEAHVRNIREKLGCSTRAQAAAWAAGQGLLLSSSGAPMG